MMTMIMNSHEFVDLFRIYNIAKPIQKPNKFYEKDY